MDLDELLKDIADALVAIDSSQQAFHTFQPGVGPYGEPQLVKLVAMRLNELPSYRNSVVTRRTPDFLIPGEWAAEFKIARPFGDNGKEAENWSVNLLHPYPGNVSTIGDCFKLAKWPGSERCGILRGHRAKGRSHKALQPSRTPAGELVHPVHEELRVFGWEVL